MHGPYGSSGTHAFPKRGQSGGAIFPLSTSPQRHAVFAGEYVTGTPNFHSASYGAYRSAIRRPEDGMTPIPRQAASHGERSSAASSCAFRLPPAVATRVYSFSTRAVPSRICRSSMEIPMRMSSGSNPATTHGMRCTEATARYASAPMTAETWAGHRNPSMRTPGSEARTPIASGIVRMEERTEKFAIPPCAAVRMAPAMAGAVVSNPTPRNTTSRAGREAASETASRGEYTTRTSSPAPFSFSREDDVPGTRSMSPKVASSAPRSFPRAIAASMYPSGVTHTGHPGPDTIVTAPDRRGRRPPRAIATVWVPHTSMIRAGRSPASFRIRRTSALAAAGSRNSSMYGSASGRIRDLPEQRQCLLRLLLREPFDGESGVHDDPLPDRDVVEQHQRDLPADSSQLHEPRVAGPFHDLCGNPQAHLPYPPATRWAA